MRHTCLRRAHLDSVRCQLKSAPMVLVADTLPDGHSAPFRRMIAHPPIVQRLNMTLGRGYSELFEPVACAYVPGTSGGSIHAGPRGSDKRGANRNEDDLRLDTGLSGAALGYGLTNGRGQPPRLSATSLRWAVSLTPMALCPAYCQGVNVQWALQDATAAEALQNRHFA